MLNLANHSSHAVMKAIARSNADGWSDHPEAAVAAEEIIATLDRAESEVNSHDYSVTAFLPKVQIVDNKESSWFGLADAKAELYVVSLALDLTGEEDINATKDSGGRVSRTSCDNNKLNTCGTCLQAVPKISTFIMIALL